MLAADPDIRRLMALRAAESGLLRLKWLAAATRFEIALSRHDRALTLAIAPVVARHVLEVIAETCYGSQKLEAGMSIVNLDRGIYKPT